MLSQPLRRGNQKIIIESWLSNTERRKRGVRKWGWDNEIKKSRDGMGEKKKRGRKKETEEKVWEWEWE